jgi:hypothetical protein
VIDFRYHVVSLVSVLLALALGLVLGSVVLDDPLVRAEAQRADTLADDRDRTQDRVRDLRARLAAERRFGEAVAPRLVAGTLEARSVLLVATPGVPRSAREEVAGSIRAAGGTVTGTLTLRPAYADPAEAPAMDALVARLVPPGVELPEGTAGERAAVELASVLVRRADGASPDGSGEDGDVSLSDPSEDAATRASVLGGFARMGLLSGAEDVREAADQAVVLAPAPDRTVAAVPEAAATLAAALGARGSGAVVAGPSSAADAGGSLAAVRSAGEEGVSTVDTLGTTAAVVAVPYALAERAAGDGGDYGRGPGASALLPDAPP